MISFGLNIKPFDQISQKESDVPIPCHAWHGFSRFRRAAPRVHTGAAVNVLPTSYIGSFSVGLASKITEEGVALRTQLTIRRRQSFESRATGKKVYPHERDNTVHATAASSPTRLQLKEKMNYMEARSTSFL